MDNLRGTVWSISNGLIDIEIQSLGAMVGPARVRIGGKTVRPFAVAPWADEADSGALVPILQRLRGEWPCVPFGITLPASSFPPHWRPQNTAMDEAIDGLLPHGYSSNRHWRCEKLEADAIELSIDYPAHSPIRSLRRRIALPAAATRIDFQLWVETRAACRLPIGLHPTLALSADTGQTELKPGAYQFGRTYPVRFEASSALAIDREFTRLDCVPQEDGNHTDLTRLPLGDMREEIVQLYGVDGDFTLVNHEAGYAAKLSWNPQDFPSCILWISNRGRDAYPWSNRHIAIGIEPTCSFFDLNPSVAANESSPLGGRNIRMLEEFVANQCWATAYSIDITGGF